MLVSQSSDEESRSHPHFLSTFPQPNMGPPILSTIKILDFAPSSGGPDGGEKLLICLSHSISNSHDPSEIQVDQPIVFYHNNRFFLALQEFKLQMHVRWSLRQNSSILQFFDCKHHH